MVMSAGEFWWKHMKEIVKQRISKITLFNIADYSNYNSNVSLKTELG